MSEEVNQNVDQEVVQPTQTEAQDQGSQASSQGSQEYNWKEARKQMSEYQRRIQDLEHHIQNQQQQVQPQLEEDDLESIDQDSYLTKRQAEALALRKTQELFRQQEIATAEDRARLKFRDYDDVVTEEHIQELINDKDVLKSLKTAEDPFALSYKLIKQSAFFNEKTKKPSREAEKLTKNAQKPVSVNTIQASPLAAAESYAFGSEAERKALWKETIDAASRRR